MSKAVKTHTIAAADRRILDAVKATNGARREHRIAWRESLRLYHEAECHPKMPEMPPGRMTRKIREAREEILRQVGHAHVSKVSRQHLRTYARGLRRVFRLKPATLRGAIAKVRFLASVDEDSLENYLWNKSPLRQILADLGRLAERAVSS